jgi:alpha-beta hydrolase superfamily lysophospholipase
MEIQEIRMRLAGVPARLLFVDSPEHAAAQGAILFYHGFTASKEVQGKELSSLAEHGFLAVGLDNVGHGERRYPNFEKRFSFVTPHAMKNFIAAVRETALEIPQVIDDLLRNGLAWPEKIGVSGISMGGYIAYASVLADRRIRAVAPILGSPKWGSLYYDSPHFYPHNFYPVALLSQNAGEDQSVSPRFACDFHKVLKPYYAEAPERLVYVEYPGVGHFMPEQDWSVLWKNVVEWFVCFLA